MYELFIWHLSLPVFMDKLYCLVLYCIEGSLLWLLIYIPLFSLYNWIVSCIVHPVSRLPTVNNSASLPHRGLPATLSKTVVSILVYIDNDDDDNDDDDDDHDDDDDDGPYCYSFFGHWRPRWCRSQGLKLALTMMSDYTLSHWVLPTSRPAAPARCCGLNS